MKKYLYLLLTVLSFSFTNDAFSQQIYHRAKINLTDKNPFLLIRAGISIDHGKMALGRYFESDFSETEIRTIKQLGFDVTVLIKDVENYYSSQDRPSEIYRADIGDRFVSCKPPITSIKTPSGYFEGSMGGYLTYNEMLIALEFMQSTYPYIITKLDTIKGSKTNDGNYVLSLKVSDNPNVDEDEPEVLYTALHHAREPNSMSQMIFYLWYLCENYTSNPEVKYLVDNTEMYFIPCVNPDGYKYNEKQKPLGGGLWRKNTMKSNNSLVGVDLNRNYGFNWGFDNIGSSNNQNSDTYRGPKAFSEKETSAIREFVVGRKIKMSMNYHAFGNLLIHPWGYSDSPTSEDKLFKGFAKQMTKENNFFTGTGSQTVGYTVNGDSDDYMYGETFEKSKIFSMTPEVGPSFWPKKTDIDYLNKSCLHMNLSLPRLVNGYLYSSLENRSKLYAIEDTVAIKITKPSFKNDTVGIKVFTKSIFSDSISSYILSLKQGQDTVLYVPYKLYSPALNTGRNEVAFYIEKNHNGYKQLDSISVDIFKGERNALFRDRASNFTNFSNTWGMSNLSGTYVSEPSSFTDSPGTLYPGNSRKTMLLKSPVDLSLAKSPYLTFNASWNVEANYDYARVFAYTTGGNQVNLCGNYTKPGSLDQLSGQPIYDGDQSNFIQEVMSLEEFQGQKEVYIGFEMVADANLNLDGIYIDDIEIVTFKPTSVPTIDQNVFTPNLSPNPSNGMFVVNNVTSNSKVDIYNLTGQLAARIDVQNTDQIDLTFLQSGTYVAKIFSNNKVYNEKIIITK
jgi:carboxypeptidase T